MPPAKGARTATTQQEDRYDDAQLARKLAGPTGVGRGRRPAAATNGTALKDPAVAVNDASAQTNGSSGNQTGSSPKSSSGMTWSTAPTSLLHDYRNAYRLSVPSCYQNSHAKDVLSTGIGKYSPTMARPRSKRRVTKENLALAVRKHFNSLPVSENEVIVDMLYKVKTKEKNFRLKFSATKGSERR